MLAANGQSYPVVTKEYFEQRTMTAFFESRINVVGQNQYFSISKEIVNHTIGSMSISENCDDVETDDNEKDDSDSALDNKRDNTNADKSKGAREGAMKVFKG